MTKNASRPCAPADDAALLGPTQVRELADAARGAAHQAVGPELRRRRQHGAQDRPRRRGRARTTSSSRSDPASGSLTLALLPEVTRSPPSRSTRGWRRPSRGTVRGAPAGECRPAAARRGRRADLTKLPGPDPTALVANLPYNISVPVVLSFLQRLPTHRAGPGHGAARGRRAARGRAGSKIYGVPSLKAAWYADVELAGRVGRNVFWPAPNVDSGLVALPPAQAAARPRPPGEEVFALHRRRVPPAPQGAAGRARRLGRLPGRRRARAARRRHRPEDPR